MRRARRGALQARLLTVLKAIGAIFARCDPAEVADLVEELLSEVQIKRPSSVYDQMDMDADLSGKPEVLNQLVRWVIWEEYSPFFRELASLGTMAERQEAGTETDRA